MTPPTPKRIVIIGGGPAGYEAALVASSRSAEVTVVDCDGDFNASVDIPDLGTLDVSGNLLTLTGTLGFSQGLIVCQSDWDADWWGLDEFCYWCGECDFLPTSPFHPMTRAATR